MFDKEDNELEILQDVSSIKDFVTNSEIKSSNFELIGINFSVRLIPSINKYGKQNGEPAEFFARPDKWDIYIWEDLSPSIQKILLFHELLEICFRNKYGIDEKTAHQDSERLQDSIAEKILDEREKIKLKELKRKHK